MLIRSQNGMNIIETTSITLDHSPCGKWTLRAADTFDPEGVIVAMYDTREEAETAMRFVWHMVAQNDIRAVIDLVYTDEHMKRMMRYDDRPKPKKVER